VRQKQCKERLYDPLNNKDLYIENTFPASTARRYVNVAELDGQVVNELHVRASNGPVSESKSHPLALAAKTRHIHRKRYGDYAVHPRTS
jgi:hypothetical protein